MDRHRGAWAILPWGILVLAVVGDLATPTDVTTAPLTVAAPVAAATVMSPPGIVAVGVTAMIVHAFLAAIDHTFGWHHGLANQLTLAGVTVLAVGINRMLARREDGLRRVRRISAVVQQAVLPTPPPRIGDLRIAARYEPAEEEGLIGGDLYAVRHSAFGTRVLIGDVRGKGLDAVRAACADVWAFRYAADHARDLPELLGMLEAALLREAEVRGGLEEEEGFTTALVVEFDPDGETVRVINRGHPAPLLLSADATVLALPPTEEAPPLGMTALGVWESPVDSFRLPAGATLLCFTDGLTEARDRHGRFYDPVARLPHLFPHGFTVRHHGGIAERLLHVLAADVRRHCGGRPQDDQALLAVHRAAP